MSNWSVVDIGVLGRENNLSIRYIPSKRFYRLRLKNGECGIFDLQCSAMLPTAPSIFTKDAESEYRRSGVNLASIERFARKHSVNLNFQRQK